jgi:hypothetical protein
VQSRINLKLNIADTAAMLAPYANASTVNNSIATKLNISDTAAMLASYTRTQRMIDSLSLVQSRINLKLNIADTAAMLAPYATVASSTSGLNTKVNISDTASMLTAYTRTQRMIDSLSLVQSRINLKLNIADTATMLSPYAKNINDATDEFTATTAQTSFTLTQIPSTHSKVKMYINGIRISNSAYSWSGKTLTYDASKNGSYSLTGSDRVQFDYFY